MRHAARPRLSEAARAARILPIYLYELTRKYQTPRKEKDTHTVLCGKERMNSEREAEQAEADSKTGEDENQDGNPNGPDDEDNRQGQDSVSPNKTTVPSSSSVSPTLPPPPLFVSALNLQPNPAIPTDISTHDKTNTGILLYVHVHFQRYC